MVAHIFVSCDVDDMQDALQTESWLPRATAQPSLSALQGCIALLRDLGLRGDEPVEAAIEVFERGFNEGRRAALAEIADSVAQG